VRVPGFSARAESLDAIGEAINENGKVIVTGCLGAEANVITERHPGVLAVTGPHQYEQVMDAVHTHLPAPDHPFVSLVPESGYRLTPRHYAYLKISEGCNNRCSFCIIPSLRGDLASRRIDAVLREAEQLTKAGVKEILVISQDTSAYGLDVKYAPYKWRDKERQTRFKDLCEGLGELGVWTRLHYVYPYPHVDDVMPMMADGRILPYLDIPFQHSSPNVLKAMRRPANIDKTADRIAKWRSEVPELVLRSSFIVGFPGETDEDFEHLLSWLKETRRSSARVASSMRTSPGRSVCRPARPCAGRGEGRTLAPLHGCAERNRRCTRTGDGRPDHRRHHRRSGRRRRGWPLESRCAGDRRIGVHRGRDGAEARRHREGDSPRWRAGGPVG
jgi:ribosomal protein S12 methylthiotransferase RimO